MLITQNVQVNNSTAIYYFVMAERMNLDSVDAVANGTVSAHAANSVDIVIYGNDGVTAAYEWSTKTSAEGELTDATKKALVDKGSQKETFEAGTLLKVSIGKSGTGPSADFTLSLHLSQARKF